MRDDVDAGNTASGNNGFIFPVPPASFSAFDEKFLAFLAKTENTTDTQVYRYDSLTKRIVVMPEIPGLQVRIAQVGVTDCGIP